MKFAKLLTAIMLVAVVLCLAACGYTHEMQTYAGEEGRMLFFGVNFNDDYKLSEGVTIEVNFAHETVFQSEIPFAIYTVVGTTYNSIFALPLEFATSESYNATANAKQIVPGVVMYTCKFPQKAMELTLPNSLFADQSGIFSLLLSGTAALSSGESVPVCTLNFQYEVTGDTVTLSQAV